MMQAQGTEHTHTREQESRLRARFAQNGGRRTQSYPPIGRRASQTEAAARFAVKTTRRVRPTDELREIWCHRRAEVSGIRSIIGEDHLHRYAPSCHPRSKAPVAILRHSNIFIKRMNKMTIS